MTQEFDLTPDPRVLQMLGEINLHQWRCLAELIDNSIDGFLHAARAGSPVDAPEIAAQGGGEPAIAPVGASIANAIFDAVGTRMYRMPMTPSRVKSALT